MAKADEVLLHLTDIHFGCDRVESEVIARDLALTALQQALDTLEPEWRPTVICISGDIGWRGDANDYKTAQSWLTKLLGDLNLLPQNLVICPGNHDIDRSISQRYARPEDGARADKILSVPILQAYCDGFKAFTEFSRSLGLPPYRLGGEESFLVGQRSLNGISFCSLNSSWFCQGEDDQCKLWLGAPQIDVMEHAGQLRSPSLLQSSLPTVTLIHHPLEWLHDAEVHARGSRPNTYQKVAERCHLILSGHSHGEMRSADRYAQKAFVLNSGATYAGHDYRNGFTLIRVSVNRFVCRSFEYDPRASDRRWKQILAAEELSFGDASTPPPIVQGAAITLSDIDSYRAATAQHADRVMEAKSRALRPWGPLPHTLPLSIAVHAAVPERLNFRDFEATDRNDRILLIPLLEVARTGRRTLVLGELGAGKSTIAANYVKEFQNAVRGSLAIYIAAKAIPLVHEEGQAWKSVEEFLSAIALYFNQQIIPGRPGVDLRSFLDSNTELALIVDGLDEMNPATVRLLLTQLATVGDYWPNIQVVATGRPVELLGVDYSSWQVCSTSPLADEQKLNLFVEEALADGMPLKEAQASGNLALRELQKLPDLHSVATTPLFCRLLFSKLLQNGPTSRATLGDLLYELVKQRLADWAQRDSKTSQTILLDSTLPDADSRARVLAKLALSLRAREKIFLEEVRLNLESILPDPVGGTKAALVDEALRNFASCGLISVEDGFSFPLQTFQEFLCGYAHVIAASDQKAAMPEETGEWRIASFASTMARRLGRSEFVRPSVFHFLTQLLQETGNASAAAILICEFRDPETARFFIRQLKQLGPRPLWRYSDNRQDSRPSTRAIGEALSLAEDEGFVWFFDEYLNPRYPLEHFGSMLTKEVFEEWAALNIGRLSAEKQIRLKSLIELYIRTGSEGVITILPALVALLPSAFEKRDRLWFCLSLLHDTRFRSQAEQQIEEAVNGGETNLVRELIVTAASTGYRLPAAKLFLSLFADRPPMQVIRALVRNERGLDDQDSPKRLATLAARIGPDVLDRILRWFLFDPDSYLGGAAAVELCDRGERRLALVGNALLRGLHDGSYVPGAERILAELVTDGGLVATRWLAQRIAGETDELGGAHSGWWRVFLTSMQNAGPEGPGLLANSVRGIGEFLLPRHPEIRQRFRDLLTGGDGAAYRGALRVQLNHPDPRTRHGAAMLLAITEPATEARAFEEIVRYRTQHQSGSWHEWERFCLGLKLGPPVTLHLKLKLSTLHDYGSFFALALLFRSGADLEPHELERLVEGELRLAVWIDEPTWPFRSRSIFDILVKIVEGSSIELAPRAGEVLLDRYGHELTPAQEARCAALTFGRSTWRQSDFKREIDRMNADSEYANLIGQVSAELIQQGFRPPLVDLLRRAPREPQVWESVIWDQLCDLGHFFDIEPRGYRILDFMRQCPEQAAAAGQAARKFLSDPRLAQPPAGNSVAWLALLADEATCLTLDELEQVVARARVTRTSVLAALVARLGHMPSALRPRQSIGMPPLFPAQRQILPQATIDSLREFCRPSETLHPNVCSTLEEFLFIESLEVEQLASLAQESSNGRLIAIALTTVYGRKPEVEWASRILGYRIYRSSSEDHCRSKLFAIWRASSDAARGDKNWESRYIAQLNGILLSGSDSESICAAAAELLSINKSLDSDHASAVLRELTRQMFDDYGLVAAMADWLASGAATAILGDLARTVEQGISDLDSQPWDSDKSYPRDSGPYLLLALLRWMIVGTTDDRSNRVFLRGLRMALMPENEAPHRTNRREGLEDVIPLLDVASMSALQSAIQYGASIEDPATRGLCRLMIVGH